MPVKRLSPGRTIIFSLCATVAIGTFLLTLPAAQAAPVSTLDAFFTATSATCVTGLLTVPIESFTLLGQSIILCLIQVGALGLITLTVFLISLFTNLGLTAHAVADGLWEAAEGSLRRPQHLVMFVTLFTLAVELLGAIGIFICVAPHYPTQQALFISVFQAVSAFCNAGFTIFPVGEGEALIASAGVKWITATLVLIGSLGFIVWFEIIQRAIAPRTYRRMSLHTKLVLSMTGLIVLATSTVVFMFEHLHAFLMSPSLRMIGDSVFNAICLRSAGFTTLNMETTHLAILFSIALISFIGSSPGSTGSGVKTTTFALFLAAIRSTLRRKTSVAMMGRTIPNEQVLQAMAISALSFSFIALILFLLLVLEPGWRFIDLMFESFSAFNNLGLSTGLTPYLSSGAKYLLMLSMLVGRIGSLTLLLAFKKSHTKDVGFQYPEERIIMS